MPGTRLALEGEEAQPEPPAAVLTALIATISLLPSPEGGW